MKINFVDIDVSGEQYYTTINSITYEILNVIMSLHSVDSDEFWIKFILCMESNKIGCQTVCFTLDCSIANEEDNARLFIDYDKIPIQSHYQMKILADLYDNYYHKHLLIKFLVNKKTEIVKRTKNILKEYHFEE